MPLEAATPETTKHKSWASSDTLVSAISPTSGNLPISSAWYHRDGIGKFDEAFELRYSSASKENIYTNGLNSASMHSRTLTSEGRPAKKDVVSDRNMVAPRWLLNGNSQLMDPEGAQPEWDLADELVKMRISSIAADSIDDLRSMKTPPQNKIISAAVAQMNEASPLESSSDTSVDSLEQQHIENTLNPIHSRGSSADTTISSAHDSGVPSLSQTLRPPSRSPLKIGTSEAKERPHSFSGGLSSADLRRLQDAGDDAALTAHPDHQQWTHSHYNDTLSPGDMPFPSEQLAYPSLASDVRRRNPQQLQQQQYQYDPRAGRPSMGNHFGLASQLDDQQVDYDTSPHVFGAIAQGPGSGAAGPGQPVYIPGRPSVIPASSFHQTPRGFVPQGLPVTPSALGYGNGHHASHLSLGNTQQLYETMVPPPHEALPAVTRVQQQHNVFRAGHHHSASDPSTMRDAASLALLNGNMQSYIPPGAGLFAPGLPPPHAMGMYPNQFYPTQDAYARNDLSAAQALNTRIQAQYTGPYSNMVNQGMGDISGVSPPGSTAGSVGGNGANSRKVGLYKTELCRSWEEKGSCRYGAKCQFAHGEEELRKVARHPKYKTEICRTFWVSGSCPYGKRCCFIHTELPTAGAPTPDNLQSQPTPAHSRNRSMSSNSDPNDNQVSLLARISAQRNHDMSAVVGNSVSTPVEPKPTPVSNTVQFTSRPPTGSLRVDTSALDNSLLKQQNKSAYPSFASNSLLHASDHSGAKSPAPVTAGPDLGRHISSRMEIVGFPPQPRPGNKSSSVNPTLRHSFNGTEVNLDLTSPLNAVSQSPPYPLPSENSVSAASRSNGHIRSGSAGNWGRLSHLSTHSHLSSPSGEQKIGGPWTTSDYSAGTSRLNEKAWA